MKPGENELPLNNAQPPTVTVRGDELAAWDKRAKAGELFIFRTDVKEHPPRYVLHILWLNGRKMYGWNEKPEPLATPLVALPEEEKPEWKPKPRDVRSRSQRQLPL